MFCFGRFYASCFDFLSTEYRLTSKRHFRRTCVCYVFLIIIFRFLLLHIAMRLLAFTLPLFFKGFSTRKKTQILEVPSKVLFGNNIFSALYFVEIFSESFQELFVFGGFTLRASTSSLCIFFFKQQTSLPDNLCLPHIAVCLVSFTLSPLLRPKCGRFSGKIHGLRSRCLANCLLTILSFYLQNVCKKSLFLLSFFLGLPSAAVPRKNTALFQFF